ncbi:pantoate--beta-alanine ligase [uncultured Pseudokineococcus sp.]|uniref:pantoate--beta-alanine ligase n=1 Tax=uncultured Pseudokineococcus sp. TaxID=1642928 RepID=UPI0026264940|nr:pantoate--beta-alanine ligase [uncultured Pseudokineococcus sp.]
MPIPDADGAVLPHEAEGDHPRPSPVPAGGRPLLVRTRAELARARAVLPGPVAAVFTMGALHEGHASLVRAARGRARSVVATVFVNPLQFGAGEDLDAYPRTLDADLELLGREGVDVVFAPSAQEVYPDGPPQVVVSAGPLGRVLEGASRPGHFDGVLTVVAKLLHLTRPDVVLFGQKDAQQLVLVRRMVADLDMGVDVVAAPTSREEDGLARSSRNAYLDEDGRRASTALSRALRRGRDRAADGAAAVRRAAAEELGREPRAVVDYVALVHPLELTEVGDDHRGPALLAVAARVGTTRLIDNVPLELRPA